jgi:hypothetical protein
VIVDSSKHPGDGAVLRYLPNVEPYFIHLVRDPRAVAYSWQRRKHSPGERSRQEMMRVGAARSSKNWVVINLGAEAIRKRQPRASLILRYESFVERPRRAIDAVLEMIHEGPAPPAFLDDRRVHLSGGHTAGGNPDRFVAGEVELREDTEWRARQTPSDRRIATAVAMPLLWRYGYPLRVSLPSTG